MTWGSIRETATCSTGAEVKFNGQQVLDQTSVELFQFGVGLSRR